MILCWLMLLLMPLCVAAESVDYQADGWCMLTVVTDTDFLFSPGDDVLTRLPAGTRMIVCQDPTVSSDWYRVYAAEKGYGYVSGDDVQLDAPIPMIYQPGFGVSGGLFTVDDPALYRVEVASLDNLEYPVVTVGRISPQLRENGQYLLVCAFTTAADVCKTTQERLCATLYDLEDRPLEVVMLTFDAPLWRR